MKRSFNRVLDEVIAYAAVAVNGNATDLAGRRRAFKAMLKRRGLTVSRSLNDADANCVVVEPVEDRS